MLRTGHGLWLRVVVCIVCGLGRQEACAVVLRVAIAFTGHVECVYAALKIGRCNTEGGESKIVDRRLRTWARGVTHSLSA
jgi:hypothetical protein